ncbi:tetratricopeptide repeat protein [Comamonas sp.]|uniref:tetratricopeptide repeat protein n=1 Tax=Comamonas sp. TaxID=34028 RepID=UPI003A9268FA
MTSSKNKRTNKPRAKKQSNPASTGGSGTSFENRVQATRLLAMCLGSSAPGTQDGRIFKLQFQARIHGNHTDDLVCHIELSDGRRFRALLQMKRTLTARETDKAFAECVEAAWTDYHSDEFVRGYDSIFFIYDTVSAAAMKGAATVCTWARYSATPEEFLKKVTAEGFSNAANRTALAVIRRIAETYAERAIDDRELFDFVKHLNCLPHDLDQDDTAEHSLHLSSIQQAAALVGEVANSREIWSRLVTACVAANGVAGTVTLDNLDAIIGVRLNGLFAGARSYLASPYAVAPLAKQALSRPQDTVATELARLSGLFESLKESHLQSAVRDQLPSARDDSVNKLISGQLDGIHARIKELRYRDGLEDLVRLSESREQFDAHQEARWHLLQGTCKWHVEGPKAAAADFIRASELFKGEDKFAAAGVRGLLLQGDVTAAAAAGAEALKTFPESLAVWQVTANAQMNLGKKLSLEDIPSALRGEADALQTLAWSRHRQDDKAGAAQAALQALDACSPSFFTRDTALFLCLDHAAGDGLAATFRVFGTDERSALERCTSEFSPREERLWQAQSSETVASATASLAMAHLLLGQPAVALAILQETHAHGISSPAFLRIEFEALAEVGDRGSAIAIGKPQIDVMPKEALATFAQLAGEADDLDAVDKALDAAIRLEPKQPGLVQNITGMRWTILAKTNVQAALQAVRDIEWLTAHSIPELVAGARVLKNAGFPDEATERIQRALALLPESAKPGERYLVAQCLLFMRDYAQAATVFEPLAPHGKHSQLHADLLFCYLRSGRRAKAKELIDSFPVGWELHSATRHMAMELGQLAGDWDLLTKLVPAEFDQAPGEVRSWLLSVIVAAHTSAAEVGLVLQNAPVELAGSTQEVAQLASLELRHGYKERAMRRLYVMRRNRLDSTEAAAAHVVALLAVTDELPLIDDELLSVVPGATVTLTDEEGRDQIFTLDPDYLPELPSTLEFLRAGSREASVIAGLTIGAELSVPDAQGEPRVLTVRRICSAYRRLLELSQLALNAPLAPSPMARMMTIHNEKTGEPDFGGLTRQLQQFNEHAKKTIDVYASSPITLGGLAKLLGRDVLDIVRGWRQDDPAIQVSGGSPDERAQVIESLKSGKGPYLIDSVTLVELGMLECLDVLTTLPKLLVTSHTRDALEAKLAEARAERAMGTAFEQDGKLGFVEVTAEQRQREIRFFQTIVDSVRKHCRVVPAYGTDSLAPIAYQIERAISAEEFSLILAAAEHEATLISLDARLRAVAATLGIHGIWPQVLLMYARGLGKLPAMSYSLATIRQLFANRTFVSVAADDLAFMAYQGSEWLKFGMSRFTRYLALPETEFTSAFRVSVEFIQRLAYQGPCHFGALCQILQLLAEGLSRHKEAPGDLRLSLFEAVLRAIPMNKDAIGREQLLRVAIQEGYQGAQEPNEGELKDVQVLMCSEPPWIAYVAELPNDEASEVGLVTATSGVKPNDDASPTSASDSANNPFR